MMNRFRSIYASLCPDALVAVWLGVWWVCNLVQAGFTELAHDEAYYQMFAEGLSWGYFDHPPMTALLIAVGEWFFGGELGVRFFFTLLQPLYLYLFWRLIRPSDGSRADAVLYVVLAAATLMLQLYGFIAVPDAPLMMTSALFLAAFKAFADGRRWAWLWMGVAMAAMAYSKYHGALVVVFVLAANWRLLLRPSLYASGAVAALLVVPHLLWQYHHDWASFAYHLSGRNELFSWNALTEYVVNLLVVFNPLFVPLYIKAWFAARPQNALERALKLLPAAFILFFLVSTFRGRIQPQWLIVGVYGLLWALFAYARRHPRTRRYLLRAGLVTVALLVLTRIEMIFNPLGIRFEIFNNQSSFTEIARIADGRPVVFRSSYAIASKYRFYTDGEAYCQPNIRYRTHQWQFRDDDARFAGRETVVECPRDMAEASDSVQSVVLPNGYRFTYFVVPRFFPVRQVDIAVSGLAERVAAGDTLRLELRLSNPYPYPIRIDNRDDQVSLAMVWKYRRQVAEFATGIEAEIPAAGELTLPLHIAVPEGLEAGDYQLGFALLRPGYTYWFNGKPLRTEVVQ